MNCGLPARFADGPDAGRRRLQPFVDLDEAAGVERDASLVQADTGGVRDAAGRDQQVAALDRPFTRRRADGHA